MSSIRQRRAPSPARPGDSFGQSSSTSWEIATDDGASPSRPSRKSIPMYNPMTLQGSRSKPNLSGSSTPSSKLSQRVSWNTIMDAKRSNMDFLRNDPLTNAYHDPPGYYASSLSAKGSRYSSLQVDRQLTSMAPALVSDSEYRAYLSGRQPQKQKKSGFDKILLAKVAGYFSIVGFLFMTFIGILIDAQPMYIQGMLEKNVVDGKNVYAVAIKDERLQPATHAYRAGLLYLFSAIVCFGYANNMYHFMFKKGWQQYQDVDDVDSTVPTFGGKDGYLPTAGTMHRKAYGDYNGFMLRTWHTTLVTIQRLGIYVSSVWQARRGNRRRFAGAKDV